jgi:hypothetical protein
MIPWSPAPCLSSSSTEPPVRSSWPLSTPWAMSADCWPMAIWTPQDAPSKPLSLLS